MLSCLQTLTKIIQSWNLHLQRDNLSRQHSPHSAQRPKTTRLWRLKRAEVPDQAAYWLWTHPPPTWTHHVVISGSFNWLLQVIRFQLIKKFYKQYQNNPERKFFKRHVPYTQIISDPAIQASKYSIWLALQKICYVM